MEKPQIKLCTWSMSSGDDTRGKKKKEKRRKEKRRKEKRRIEKLRKRKTANKLEYLVQE